MTDPIVQREAERAGLIALAREYVASLTERIPVIAAAVVGSVARGDFNVWSDIDVVIVAEGLPASVLERQWLLLRGAPAGVQPVGFGVGEFRAAVAKRDRIACEAVDAGVPLVGADFFRQSARQR